jgi:hypothetical protein
MRNRTFENSARSARCVAHDDLSGIASCTRSVRHSGPATTVTAVATDRAGNIRATHVRYTSPSIAVADAPFARGAFVVKAGHGYTVVVRGSAIAPVYYDVAVSPSQPTSRDTAFHAAGHGRWVLGVAIDKRMRSHAYWNLGVKIGPTLHVIKIRVT